MEWIGISVTERLVQSNAEKYHLCRIVAQCVKGPIFVQKLQILEKLENGQFLFFVSKLTIFSD